jgi:hypothetical protein
MNEKEFIWRAFCGHCKEPVDCTRPFTAAEIIDTEWRIEMLYFTSYSGMQRKHICIACASNPAVDKNHLWLNKYLRIWDAGLQRQFTLDEVKARFREIVSAMVADQDVSAITWVDAHQRSDAYVGSVKVGDIIDEVLPHGSLVRIAHGLDIQIHPGMDLGRRLLTSVKAIVEDQIRTWIPVQEVSEL